MILVNNKKLYLIFFGTQINFNDFQSMIKDIFTDINFGIEIVNEFGKGVGIHHAYKSNMNNQNLIGQIEKIVRKYIDHKIILCSHSMGCGLATYTSMVLSKQFPDKNFNLVLISAPKLGNAKLSKFIENTKNITLYNMMNNKEFAPLFPFYPFCPSYKNVGNKIFKYKPDGTYEILNYVPNNIFEMYSIKDHFIKNIIPNIYECMKK